MVIVNGYCTLAEVKARLDILDSKADAILEPIVEAASRQIDGWTGRVFFATTETRTVTAEFGDVLFLDDDLHSITSIAVDDDGDRVYETAWAETDFELDGDPPHRTIHTTPNGVYLFPATRRAIQVTGDWGYSATAPHAIREACLLLAARLYKRKDAPFGIAGSADHGQLQTLPGMDPDVKQLLMPYRAFAVLGV